MVGRVGKQIDEAAGKNLSPSSLSLFSLRTDRRKVFSPFSPLRLSLVSFVGGRERKDAGGLIRGE